MTSTPPANLPKNMPALDALRGIAVMLVIASHSFPLAQNLPWALKRFSNLGFFGVQLFFLVSCITLANSWRRSEVSGAPSLRAFALRRIFRIVPAYFLAAAGYALLRPDGYPGATRLLTFVSFTSGWSPTQMPTVPNTWVGVPGGWSIEAECAFYALFPLLIVALRGLPRSAAACALSLPLAWLANRLGRSIYEPLYGPAATGQFLYYWLPNQLPAFLAGLVTYDLMQALSPGGRWQNLGHRIALNGPIICVASAFAFLSLAFLPWPRLPQLDHACLPVHMLACLAFSCAAIALTLRPLALIVHPIVVAMGHASFSAYLLHFAIIEGIGRVMPAAVLADTGMIAALTGCALFLLVLGLAALVSQATFRLVEKPGIALGARLAHFSDERPRPASGRL